MARQLIDISIHLENDVPSDPQPLIPKIRYRSHKDTLKEALIFFPGMKPEDFPDGEFGAV